MNNVDYAPFALFLTFQPSDFTSDGAAFTARQEVPLAIVDDLFDEPDETLTLQLERSPGLSEMSEVGIGGQPGLTIEGTARGTGNGTLRTSVST